MGFMDKFGNYFETRVTTITADALPYWCGTGSPPSTSTYALPIVPKQEVKKMRSLFTVFIIEEETGAIVLEKTVVATDETQAQQKALLSSGIKLAKDLDEYVTIVDLRGNRNIIEPRTKLQKVKIVKDEVE